MVEFGPYRVCTLLDARFALDGGSMFGVVPRTLWERAAVPDDRNRIPLAARLLYVEGEGRRMLVDTGMGSKWDAKRRDIFAVQSVDGGVVAALAQRGVAAEAITDVVLTHLHFDHAAGTTFVGEAGELELTFPAAVHHVQRRQWEWAHRPALKDAGSFRREDFALLADSSQLRLHDGDAVPYPGIGLLELNGHTTAMQAVRVGVPGNDLLYVADLVPTVAHLAWPYIMGFDNLPLTTLEEKLRLLPAAASDGTVIVFEHDPEVAAARLRQTDRGVAVEATLDI